MDPIINQIIFYCLGAAIVGMSLMAILSNKLLRAATYLLLVLICTAGLYLFLNYHFLAAIQLSVYAGGILILFIFAIFLTNSKDEVLPQHNIRKALLAGGSVLAGIAVTAFVVFKHQFLYAPESTIMGDQEIDMKVIGEALMGTGKYQYLLPFEALSILLLACIIGGILIARKR